MQISRRDAAKALAVASGAGTLTAGAAVAAASNTAPKVLIEWQAQPLAIDVARPRFHWTLAALAGVRGTRQSSFRVMIRDDRGETVLDTGRLAAVALFCVGTASAFGWLLAYYRIPQELLANVTSWGLGPIGVGFFIALVFLVVGCFLDAIPAIIIVGTVLQPLAQSVDMNPVHFAIVSIVALAFGLVTPPYGLCLMISCAVAGVRLRYALKDTMIMLVPMILVLAAMIVWPDIALFLPRLIAPDLMK